MIEHAAFYYSAAAALAAGLAYRLLRARGGQESPAADSRIAKFGEHIKLRDLFRLAVMMEEEGTAFYLKMAERVQNPGARKLCIQLAEEETEHRRLFQDRLNRWRSLAPNRLTWPAFLEKVRQEGLFNDQPGDGAAEDEMAAFAIAQERKTADFYRLFEAAFPDAWKREKLKSLVEQELDHEAKLRAAYPHLH